MHVGDNESQALAVYGDLHGADTEHDLPLDLEVDYGHISSDLPGPTMKPGAVFGCG